MPRLEPLHDFGPFDGRAWLNTAHQGALPRVAARSAQEALQMMITPHRIEDEAFLAVPKRLRRALAQLIGAAPDDIILGNSASYGLHLLANGIEWRRGDEILVPAGDFPTTVLPWLGLQESGVAVRSIRPNGPVLSVEDLEGELSSKTRLVCASWVNSLNGHVIDVSAIGRLCHQAGVLLVLDGAQGTGVRPIDVHKVPVDALTSCGFKFLCGPYATGFCWMTPELRGSLRYNQAYWQAHWGAEQPSGKADFNLEAAPEGSRDLGARAYDVFATANFLNFMPWTASLEYQLGLGAGAVAEHDDELVTLLLRGLDSSAYRVVSPIEPGARSAIVVITHRDQRRNRSVHRFLKERGVEIALRGGMLRISPHLNNTRDDVERALDLLTQAHGSLSRRGRRSAAAASR